jgi:hypothetical protein
VNFGVGIMGSNNIVEANSGVGNSNGIVVFPNAANNSIRQNVAVGNPPIQQSNSLPTSGGNQRVVPIDRQRDSEETGELR